MHNKRNIVLLFLIIMLSFAIVSEVSAVAVDEAEPAESGLNEEYGSFHSSDPQIPSERFHEVSQGSFDDSVDAPHSDNNQNSLRPVPGGTNENMNLYEQMPLEQISPDAESQKPQRDFDASDINPDEKMNDAPMDFNHDSGFKNNDSIDDAPELMDKMPKRPVEDIFFNGSDLRFNDADAPGFMDNEDGEAFGEITSELIAMENISRYFKNNRGFMNLPDNGTFSNRGDLDQFNGDLHFPKHIPKDTLKENISPLKNELPEINNAIPEDFFPRINETQHFPHMNDMPIWNSTNKEFKENFESNKDKEGELTLNEFEGEINL